MFSTSRQLHHKLAHKREKLHAQLAEVRELLDDIAEAEADVSWCEPVVPVAHVPNRLEDLLRHLRQLFQLEEDARYLAELCRQSPELRAGFEQLNADHEELLELLEQLCELSGTSVRAATSWGDIEVHYRCFERRFAQHRQGEDALLEGADLAEV